MGEYGRGEGKEKQRMVGGGKGGDDEEEAERGWIRRR